MTSDHVELPQRYAGRLGEHGVTYCLCGLRWPCKHAPRPHLAVLLLEMCDDAIASHEAKGRAALHGGLGAREDGGFWCRDCSESELLCPDHETNFRAAFGHYAKAEQYREARLLIQAAVTPAAKAPTP
ncbi:MAG TPA: hypothetical protein VLZ06_06840 [Solirubrobacteraceae bacterium]|nr:hypothetical protein [Solirubrobacteraceae bacterium]